MESSSTFDPTPELSGLVQPGSGASGKEVRPGHALQISPASVSDSLMRASEKAGMDLGGTVGLATSNVRSCQENAGHSLAEIARRDLDAALQLLADRAQYITAASGAAIALRRQGRNDMLCRASTGSNAPELGALLSTEFGLSGQSVRTRQALRCDDAERDVRVNREVCRQLGIASVVVMPVVNDDEVLGVFELFSGKVNAFGDRDVSAVQRLSEMVETAVRLATAAEKLPERLSMSQGWAPAVTGSETETEEDQEDQVLEVDVLGVPALAEQALSGRKEQEEAVLEEQPPVVSVLPAESPVELAKSGGPGPEAAEKGNSSEARISPKVSLSVESKAAIPEPELAAPTRPAAVEVQGTQDSATGIRAASQAPEAESPKAMIMIPETVAAAPQPGSPIAKPVPPPSEEPIPSKKQLFWSAALNPPTADAQMAEGDQSHVPPGLRGLRKCEACGFPVSAGRVLCVECEERKWRGQLRVPQAAAAAAAGVRSESRAFPAVNQSAGTIASTPLGSATGAATTAGVAAPTVGNKPIEATVQPLSPAQTAISPIVQSPSESATEKPETPSSNFVLSAGLESSQSWLSANKYLVGILLMIGMLLIGILVLR